MNKIKKMVRQHDAWIKKHMPNFIEAFKEEYGTSSYYKEIYEKIPEIKRPKSKKPEVQEAQYEYNRANGQIREVIKILEKIEENEYETLEEYFRTSHYEYLVMPFTKIRCLERAKEAELFLKERGYI